MCSSLRTGRVLLVNIGLLLLLLSPLSAETATNNPDVRGTLEFQAIDLAFNPGTLNVDSPGHYRIKLVNKGQLRHSIKFSNGTEVVADPGQTKMGDVTIPENGLRFFCSVLGHEGIMKGQITVAGRSAAAAVNAATAMKVSHQALPPPMARMPLNMKTPPPPFIDATAPQLSPGNHHEYEVAAIEKEMTIVPGMVQRVWTFNGAIPAPTFRVRVGDTLKIRFRNVLANKAPHSLDYHASEAAANDEMRTINPGDELTMDWKANYAGVFMYHCVTSPPVHHVASGMYGMIIVEPKEGLPKADHEYVIIQNEWYLGPPGGTVSLEKAMAAAPAPDYMAFNGIPDQYMDRPLTANKGERLRFFVLNVGPNIESSFHIVGMIFDTVIKEGMSLLPNNTGKYGSQSVDLAPAQGAIVEAIAPKDGMYEFVTHTFNFHDRGARGAIQIGDGIPKSGIKVTRTKDDTKLLAEDTKLLAR